MAKIATFSVQDLSFYLDAQRQDGIDRGAQTVRVGQVLALREKLLLLPGQEFELAMRTLTQMVENKAGASTTAPAPAAQTAGRELYRQVRPVENRQS